ncbi:hypothetical protein MZA94_06625 [Haemophilus influenzae]|nr:hypothetical protein [Haemophilus influenzae]MCK9143099.1 hypothetical protein [Haemophilus influenzae]
MSEQEKMRLDEQLEQAAKQLTHALRALRMGKINTQRFMLATYKTCCRV